MTIYAQEDVGGSPWIIKFSNQAAYLALGVNVKIEEGIRKKEQISWLAWFLLTFLMLRICVADNLWPEYTQRLNVGINLLPACLSADLSLANKLTPEGSLRILVLHQNDQAAASSVATSLLALKTIGGYAVEVETLSTSAPQLSDDSPVAAIFIASPGIKSEIFNHWITDRQSMVFSPFSGDVERGVVAGLYVTDRILPFINLSQAKKAGVVYKPFFLRIAKQYD